MSRSNCTLIITEGPAGSGKSLCRCAYAIPEFLREIQPISDEFGELVTPALHISNFPIRLEDWTDDEGKDHKGMASLCESEYGVPTDQVRQRIEIIPEEVLESWRRFESGPWEYFKDRNISGCHIAIDEAHHYCPSPGRGKAAIEHKVRWQKWLGEIRHSGATVELLSQDVSKIAGEVVKEAALRISLINGENVRVFQFRFFAGILQSDIFELVAKFVTGRYISFAYEQEMFKVHGKWKTQSNRSRRMLPRYFDTYDSYSAPQAGGRAGKGAQRAYLRYSHIGILCWFYLRNSPICTAAMAVMAVFCWLFLFGGVFKVAAGIGYAASLPAKIAAEQSQAKQTPGVSKTATPGVAPSTTPAVRPAAVVARDRIAELPADVRAQIKGPVEKELIAAHTLIEQVKQDLAAAQAAATAAQQEAAALSEKLRRAFEVVAISETRVTFREGYSYGIGELIDWGPYEGDSVQAINWDRRLVTLSSGKVLRMGATEPRTTLVRAVTGVQPGSVQPVVPIQPSSVVDSGTGQGGASPLRGSLPSTGGQRVDPVDQPADKAADSPQRSRNATYPVRTSIEQSDRSFNRR